ncbi:hypothetical protein GCM10028794_09430 [Silanimonas algicola]
MRERIGLLKKSIPLRKLGSEMSLKLSNERMEMLETRGVHNVPVRKTDLFRSCLDADKACFSSTQSIKDRTATRTTVCPFND